jgi:hypothetical protein
MVRLLACTYIACMHAGPLNGLGGLPCRVRSAGAGRYIPNYLVCTYVEETSSLELHGERSLP